MTAKAKDAKPQTRMIWAVLIAIGGCIVLALNGRDAVKASMAQSWPQVPAQITALETRPCKTSSTLYVRYLYQLEGVEYTDDTYSFVDNGCQKKFLTDMQYDALRALRASNSFTVHVNPGDPKQSTVTAGAANGELRWVSAIIIGFLMVMAGMAYAMGAYREMRNGSASVA